MTNILFINPAISNKISLALLRDHKIIVSKIFKSAFRQSKKLLPAIDKLLKENKISLQKLRGIVVVRGPGQFSALRVGVATANTLSFALNIPLVGFRLTEFKDLRDLTQKARKRLERAKPGEIVLPFYGREPNIMND